MKFYKFGDQNKPVIMLLPGTCCHWNNNFGHVLGLLEEAFYVVCASYDGFDETEQTEFTDMITEVKKIEDYIESEFNGHIHAAYGCSMGGSFVGLMMQREQVHMSHAIIGSSDLDQAEAWKARMQTNIVVPIFFHVVHKGRVNSFILKKIKKKIGEQYTEKFIHMMFGIGGQKLDFVTKRSLKNQFYSDLVTPLEDGIHIDGTAIHCLYAAKMGTAYLMRYQKHFKNPHIIKHDLQHEELLACKPEEWAEVIRKCAGLA